MPTFGQTLKALRENAGLSQAKLAEKAGVGQVTISTWELDSKEPTLSNIQKLCDALGVTCDVFFAKEEAEPEKPKKAKKKAK